MKLAVYMASYYLAHAVYQSYMSLFYQSRGLSPSQIGAIFAGVAFLSVGAQLLWGTVGDRSQSVPRVLRLLLLCSAGLLLCCLAAHTFPALFLLSLAFGFFYMPVQPLSDAVALSKLNREKKPFGPIRLMGAIAFSLSALVSGFLIDAQGRENRIVLIAAGLMLLAAGCSLLLAREPGRGAKRWAGELLRDRSLMALLGFTLPMQATMGYFYSCFPTHFLSLPGANSAMLGWAHFLASVAEIPFLLFCDRLYRRFGAPRMLAAAAVALCLRWGILGLFQDVCLALFSQALHGMGYIVVTVSMAKYISQHVPEDLRNSGQTLLCLFSFGVARVLGNLLGGLAAGWLGMQKGFLLCSGICLLSLLLYPRKADALQNPRDMV